MKRNRNSYRYDLEKFLNSLQRNFREEREKSMTHTHKKARIKNGLSDE